LIVDDDPDIRAFLEDTVRAMTPYIPVIAESGEMGLRMARKVNPDLIILDYELPDMKGVDVVQALHDEECDIPVVFITSYGSESVAIEVFRLGVHDYLPKPFTFDELLRSVQRVFKQVSLEEERERLIAQLKETNTQLSRRVWELDTLYAIGKSVTMLRQRDQQLQRIVDAAMSLTDAREGSVILLDPQTSKPSIRVKRERTEEGIRSSSDQTARAVAQDKMLAVPLQIGEKLYGALTVSQKLSDEAFTLYDDKLLRMVGDYATVVIENNMLLDKLEERRIAEQKQLRALFEHYVASSVVERILDDPRSVKPGGVRQPISVLFADLRGFTTFSTQASPESLISVLNKHIAAAAEVILNEEGTLDKFMGDEVMAFFNAPLSIGDYALRSARAALCIHQRCSEMHAELPRHHRLRFGIGLCTGEAIVGNVGTDTLMNFTVVGPTVNRAHSLQELAPPGRVLIDQGTYDLIESQAKVRKLGTISLKGNDRPEMVYELLKLDA
jgi:class 3 adenylate cyclase/DNA-binding response OmpR family regulator